MTEINTGAPSTASITTGRQIAAARALLRWDGSTLAEKAGLHRNSVWKFENRESIEYESDTVKRIRSALQSNGIAFTHHGAALVTSKPTQQMEQPQQMEPAAPTPSSNVEPEEAPTDAASRAELIAEKKREILDELRGDAQPRDPMPLPAKGAANIDELLEWFKRNRAKR